MTASAETERLAAATLGKMAALLLPDDVWDRVFDCDATFASRGRLSNAATPLHRALSSVKIRGRQIGAFRTLCPRFFGSSGQPVPYCRILRAPAVVLRWVNAERKCDLCDALLSSGSPPPCDCVKCIDFEWWKYSGDSCCKACEEQPEIWKAEDDAPEEDYSPRSLFAAW